MSSITNAAELVSKKGASSAIICATHALLSKNAPEKLKKEFIKEVIVTNTIAISKEKEFDKLKIISIVQLLAESIKRIHEGEPMGVLFDGLYKKLAEKSKNGRK